mgnify:CR=1 FL=1
MKPTDFSIHLTNFLTHHLAAQRNLSPNTIKAYRDVFTLLLRFCRDVRGMALERLSLAQIDVPLLEAFLDHLGNDRHCSIPTQKSSPRHIACVLPLCAVRSPRALAAVPTDPGHSPEAPCSPNRWLSL